MGLDMYMYRAKMPALKMGIYSADDESVSDLIQISKDEIDNPMYKELLPFMARIQIAEHHYDTDAIARDYKLGENVGPSSFNSLTTTFSGSNGVSPPIPNEVIKSSYTKTVIKTKFVTEIQEIYYWRKAYNVQNLIHNNMDYRVENCGFYRVTEDLAKEIHKMDSDFPTRIVDDKTADVFYHEWY